MSLKETIENNPVIWMLGIVVMAFLAGIGAYHGIIEISESQIVSRNAKVLTEKQKAITLSEFDELVSKSDRLNTVAANLAQCETKKEFLARYLRYELEKDSNQKNEDSIKLAEKRFVALILRWWKKQEELEGSLILNQQIKREGFDQTNSRIEFADSTDVWPIPAEIKNKVLHLSTK